MIFVFNPGFIPAFTLTKDVLLYLGVAFILKGLTMIVKASINNQHFKHI